MEPDKDHGREGERPPGVGAPGERPGEAPRTGQPPEPTPEEVPELLGERSDYPAPFGEADESSGE